MSSLEDENRELTAINAKREEALNQTNVWLFETFILISVYQATNINDLVTPIVDNYYYNY